mmetsp:Transcript_3227/g.7005  ORF Transcript_3227/g.7005 Transcript_3227/m.7005 type:complete len:275 (-) Transcript_3227:490-1314(-)
MIPDRNDRFQFPENGLGVAMVVVTHRYILFHHGFPRVQDTLDVFVKPGLVEATNFVQGRSTRNAVHQVTRHHDHIVDRVRERLHKTRLCSIIFAFCERAELFNSLFQFSARVVPQSHEWFARNDRELHRRQEAKRTVRPRQRVEQIGVLVVSCDNHTLTVTKHKLVLQHQFVKKSVLVARCFDAHTHEQSTDSQVIHLRRNWESPAARCEEMTDLTHRNHRLNPHVRLVERSTLLFLRLLRVLFRWIHNGEDVEQVDVNVGGRFLVASRIHRNR